MHFTFGILRIGVIKKNFCLNLPEIDADGCNGCLRQRSVEEILKTKNYVRESKWSQSIAVVSKSFVEGLKEKLGIRAKGRKVRESGGLYHLSEAQVPYNSDFTPENSELRAKNTYF